MRSNRIIKVAVVLALLAASAIAGVVLVDRTIRARYREQHQAFCRMKLLEGVRACNAFGVRDTLAISQSPQELLTEEAESGLPLLHLASLCDDTEIVEALLAAGARMDAVDRSGRTPAEYAVAQGKPHAVGCLVGLPRSPGNGAGPWCTALNAALATGNLRVARLILESDAAAVELRECDRVAGAARKRLSERSP